MCNFLKVFTLNIVPKVALTYLSICVGYFEKGHFLIKICFGYLRFGQTMSGLCFVYQTAICFGFSKFGFKTKR